MLFNLSETANPHTNIQDLNIYIYISEGFLHKRNMLLMYFGFQASGRLLQSVYLFRKLQVFSLFLETQGFLSLNIVSQKYLLKVN